jgi:hypothetical protein
MLKHFSESHQKLIMQIGMVFTHYQPTVVEGFVSVTVLGLSEIEDDSKEFSQLSCPQ